MVTWGCNILHTDDVKYFSAIIDSITREFLAYAEGEEDNDFTVCNPLPENQTLVTEMLENGLLDAILEEIAFRYFASLPTIGAGRYMYILAVVISMKYGATISTAHIDFARACSCQLVSPFHQVQVITACDEYKNDGTPWIFEAKDARTLARAKTKGGRGDRKLGNGLGHSADEPPVAYCCSKTCVACGKEKPRLVCKGCKIFRYCDKRCLENDQRLHRETCPPRFYDGSLGEQWYLE
ncbi:hypothetical protein FDECE_7882 [Fusarium decemcellulare]|nr:hypothetical protein FDECE_7882 [Fusarium decemcellulare]